MTKKRVGDLVWVHVVKGYIKGYRLYPIVYKESLKVPLNILIITEQRCVIKQTAIF